MQERAFKRVTARLEANRMKHATNVSEMRQKKDQIKKKRSAHRAESAARQRVEEDALAARMVLEEAENERKNAMMQRKREVQIEAQRERRAMRSSDAAAARKRRANLSDRHGTRAVTQIPEDGMPPRRGRGGRMRSRRAPMKRPTNRKIVHNAIVWVCLAGEHLKAQREPTLRAIDQCDASLNLIILFGSNKRLVFRGEL